MKAEFNVMEWLREVRDRHAEETEGLTPEQRAAALKDETREWAEEFFKNHPEARPKATPAPTRQVAEPKSDYGSH